MGKLVAYLSETADALESLPALSDAACVKSRKAAYMVNSGWDEDETTAFVGERNQAEIDFRNAAS
jgi:hypothetical protein